MRRHRLLGPWSPADVLLQLLYILLNVFYVTFRVTSFNEAGDRAGTLSIINIAPLFFGLYLSFLADLLGLLLSNYRRIYRSAGIISFALVALHIFAAVYHDPTYSLRVPGNLYLLIVSYGHFRRHFAYSLAGYIYSQLLNGTLITLYPQAFVRILPP